MKKLHFSLMAIFFALFAMVSFTACSSDDDEVPSTEAIKENIVGMWQTTHILGWAYDDTSDENLIKVDRDITENDSYAERILFRADGICTLYHYSKYSNKWVMDYSGYPYEVSGNKVIIYNRSEVEQTFSILSLNNDQVIIEYEMDEGPDYKTKVTCKRVN